ncbi:MAG: carbon storage regulator CsrA [Pseudomonas taetrolens]|uniref:carbon storage regulator CsrA n=1 Tax=Pseudomonas taetrolens TaxID=47884 RepID=UPI003F9DA239
MLILSRAIDEYISIDQNIKVRIIGVSGAHVRLGVEAPRDVGVHRTEIYERIKNEEAKGVPDSSLITR